MEQTIPRPTGRRSSLGLGGRVSIRVATPTDFLDLLACEELAFDMPVRDQCAIEASRNGALAARLREGAIRVVESGTGIIGYISYYPGSDHLFVDAIAVVPRHQGNGVGSMLLRNAELIARRDGLGHVRLFTDGRIALNMRFYRRHGYHETGRHDDVGFSRVYMSKAIAA